MSCGPNTEFTRYGSAPPGGEVRVQLSLGCRPRRVWVAGIDPLTSSCRLFALLGGGVSRLLWQGGQLAHVATVGIPCDAQVSGFRLENLAGAVPLDLVVEQSCRN